MKPGGISTFTPFPRGLLPGTRLEGVLEEGVNEDEGVEKEEGVVNLLGVKGVAK